ncbi:MAG TPA: glycosyltransferase family 9 protein [Sulfurovum sp.]|nr:glycosyltransferase family 9 protein [Sulfurovum sp.]
MAQAFHIKLRKKLALFLQSTLRKIFLKVPEKTKIDTSIIQKILVVRINYRIGNILFTTPLLNALSKQFPDAQIDMILGAPFIAPLIEGMPNINKVYSFDRQLLKHPLDVLSLRKEINQNEYDLMVLSSGLSTSDTLISWLIHAKNKIGFYDKNSFKNLTYIVDAPTKVEHEALVPLLIMEELGESSRDSFDHHLDIRLTKEEKKKVETPYCTQAIGIFRDARNEKKIDDAWWRELIKALKELDASLTFVDILDPNSKVPLEEDMQTISEKNLRILAAKIGNLKAFICGDTGPMHLSSASKTPTIALFKTTSPTLYGTLGRDDLSLEMKEKSVKEIAKEILDHLKESEGKI